MTAGTTLTAGSTLAAGTTLTAESALLVLIGGMLGAPARYLLDRWVRSMIRTTFPWGTWVVNVTGSALLGFLAAGPFPSWVMAGVGTGFCGALTTYSTFGYEAVRLVEAGAWPQAVRYVLASLTAGVGVAALAALVATWLWG
jgi:CrcB protein